MWIGGSGAANPGLHSHTINNASISEKSAHDKVFNRFYRADTVKSRELGGTGLGLAIVKHLMRLHGGSVELESELGCGSTFTLIFPERAVGELAFEQDARRLTAGRARADSAHQVPVE